MLILPREVEITHFHLFCGLGGGARGFARARFTAGGQTATYRCLGGVDVDAAAITDFEQLAGARGTVLDLFNRTDYETFHGRPVPTGWREASPDDIRAAAGGERPNVVLMSCPCKGFSGLLSNARSSSPKYQALNSLALRGIWLLLEAWADDPPELVLFENVPRIATRGRHLLDQVGALLAHYGYAVAPTTHDCGELGGLAQSRKRFLLVARHREKVPPFLWEPQRRPLRAVGQVLEHFPLPGDPAAGPMHTLRRLHWRTWVRLAFVAAGSDWRSLQNLRVVDGKLADYAILPASTHWHPSALGVTGWDHPAGTVTGESRPSNGRFAVADPRPPGWEAYGQFGVIPWDGTAATVTSQGSPGQGPISVADPRPPADGRYNNVFRVVAWSDVSPAITGGGGPTSGGLALADPRATAGWGGKGKYQVAPWHGPAATIIAGSTTGQGAFAIADPRPTWGRSAAAPWAGGGHYGVVPWTSPSGAVTGRAGVDTGAFAVADPRLPEPDARLVAVIQALDGTWHRPFTTLELAALQGLVDPEEDALALAGSSDSAWRERIGNAIPAPAAQAIAETMARTLLMAWRGETFALSATPVWVRPLAIALSVETPS